MAREGQPRNLENPDHQDIKERKIGEIPSEISLHFFRHSKKESADKLDEEIDITEEGAEIARSKADFQTNIAQSVAFGSDRIRTQETAAFVMAGEQEGVKDIKPEDVIDFLNDQLDYGSKVAEDERLNFVTRSDEWSSGKYEEAMNKAYGEGKYLDFVLKESDKVAAENYESNVSTYTSQAAAIASIVLKYVKASDRFHELVNEKPDQYQQEMERFLGSHQGVLESFIGKLIEAEQGKEGLNEFTEQLNSQGFDFVEGFDVKIKRAQLSISPEIDILYTREGSDGEKFEFNRKLSKFELQKIVLNKEIQQEEVKLKRELRLILLYLARRHGEDVHEIDEIKSWPLQRVIKQLFDKKGGLIMGETNGADAKISLIERALAEAPPSSDLGSGGLLNDTLRGLDYHYPKLEILKSQERALEGAIRITEEYDKLQPAQKADSLKRLGNTLS